MAMIEPPMAPPEKRSSLVTIEGAEEIHLNKLLERFKTADVDGDNALNAEEFRSVLECSDEFCLKEHWIPMERVNQLLAKYDKEGNGKIGVSEFIAVAEDHLLLYGALSDYEHAFDAIDKDSDGKLTADEVKDLILEVHKQDATEFHLSPEELAAAMNRYGDESGVDFNGFLGLAHEHFYELKELLNYLEIPTGEHDLGPAEVLDDAEIKRISEAWKERRARLCSTNMRAELCEMILMSNSPTLAAFKNVDPGAQIDAREFGASSSLFDDLMPGTENPAIKNFRVKGMVSPIDVHEDQEQKDDKPSWIGGLIGSAGSSTRTFGTVEEISSEDKLDDILRSDPEQTVILQVGFTWCRACKSFARKYSKYASLYPKVRFVRVIGNQNESTKRLAKERLGVTFAPVFFSFRNGKIMGTHRGIKENQFRDFLRADLRPAEMP